MPGDSGLKSQSTSQDSDQRIYCVCLFERGAVVPAVKLIDAASDEQAVAIARSIDPCAEREIWDRHRLVAHFPARRAEAPRAGNELAAAG